ncbi:MAG: EamA family transporter RarD [Actinobacteria bacterium]|nr:EamA family transporter RarD [Actinomycetota bacterium]
MNSPGRHGAIYGMGAYLLWGIFPLYFRLLERSGAVEVVLHRILWSLLVCAVVLTAVRQWSVLRATLASPRTVGVLGTAAVLLAVNWGTYIYGVNSGHVVEASLGYFINPLVTVLLGVVVLKERLRPAQWVAVGLGTVAVVVLTVDYGRPPVIALTLAVTFGMYGLLKNRVGATVGALASLSTETLVLAPLAAVGIVVLEVRGQGHFGDDAPWQALLLMTTGVVTVVPLLFFAAAARRIPLSTMGLLQYVTPVLQLLCGVLVFGERMPLSRWLGFGIVWAALAVMTVDSLRTARTRSRAAPAAEPVPA